MSGLYHVLFGEKWGAGSSRLPVVVPEAVP